MKLVKYRSDTESFLYISICIKLNLIFSVSVPTAQENRRMKTNYLVINIKIGCILYKNYIFILLCFIIYAYI